MQNIQNFFRNKKVLITGHTGFKGSWLTKILLNWGANVAGIALKPSTSPSLFYLLNIEKEINIDPDMFDQRPDYLLKVKGLSMRDAGILDGDLLAIKKTGDDDSGFLSTAARYIAIERALFD